MSRPLRSVLSILGLAVAISGMVGLFSIAGGIDRVVSSTFDQIPGLVVQQQGAPVPLFSTLPAEWGQELEGLPGVGVVDPEVFCRVNQLDGKVIINPPRFAVGLNIEERLKLKRTIYGENMIAGHFLDRGDELSNKCVISKEIATGINKTVGDSVRINGSDFNIIGIFHTGSLMLDVNILMDIGTCRRLGRISPDTVGCFYVEPDGTIDDQTLKDSILDHFRGRELGSSPTTLFGLMPTSENPLSKLFRNLDRTAKGDVETPAPAASTAIQKTESEDGNALSPIEVRTADDWSERFREFSGDLNIFLGLMTTIGVSIATLSIVNTMMMSVTERTTEFGILRANGWSKREIVRLMTMESGLLGFFGGLIGVVIGWLGTHVINGIWPDRLQLHAGIVLLSFSLLFAVCLGLIGGVYPAWRASQLSPMESIRRG